MLNNTSKMGSETIHIIMCVESMSSGQNQHVGVALTSAVLNTSLPITAHILYYQSIESNDAEYQNQYNKYSELMQRFPRLKIEFKHIPFDSIETPLKKYFQTHPKVKILSPAASLRCFAHEFLDNVDWVLYLDTDVIVDLDLSTIWCCLPNLSHFALIGCLDDGWDSWPKKIHRIHDKYGLQKDTYINSGVMVMNLKKIRDEYDLNSVASKLILQRPRLPFYDQDIINVVFKGDIYYLPSEIYNSMILLYPGRKSYGCIIHFASEKPWQIFNFDCHYKYWEYLIQSPWGDLPTVYAMVNTLVDQSTLDERILHGRINNYNLFIRNLFLRFCNVLLHVMRKYL